MIDDYLKKHGSSLKDTVLDPVTTREGTVFTNQRGTVREPNKRSYLEFECYFIAFGCEVNPHFLSRNEVAFKSRR